jgi:hypothetical protein
MFTMNSLVPDARSASSSSSSSSSSSTTAPTPLIDLNAVFDRYLLDLDLQFPITLLRRVHHARATSSSSSVPPLVTSPVNSLVFNVRDLMDPLLLHHTATTDQLKRMMVPPLILGTRNKTKRNRMYEDAKHYLKQFRSTESSASHITSTASKRDRRYLVLMCTEETLDINKAVVHFLTWVEKLCLIIMLVYYGSSFLAEEQDEVIEMPGSILQLFSHYSVHSKLSMPQSYSLHPDRHVMSIASTYQFVLQYGHWQSLVEMRQLESTPVSNRTTTQEEYEIRIAQANVYYVMEVTQALLSHVRNIPAGNLIPWIRIMLCQRKGRVFTSAFNIEAFMLCFPTNHPKQILYQLQDHSDVLLDFLAGNTSAPHVLRDHYAKKHLYPHTMQLPPPRSFTLNKFIDSISGKRWNSVGEFTEHLTEFASADQIYHLLHSSVDAVLLQRFTTTFYQEGVYDSQFSSTQTAFCLIPYQYAITLRPYVDMVLYKVFQLEVTPDVWVYDVRNPSSEEETNVLLVLPWDSLRLLHWYGSSHRSTHHEEMEIAQTLVSVYSTSPQPELAARRMLTIMYCMFHRNRKELIPPTELISSQARCWNALVTQLYSSSSSSSSSSLIQFIEQGLKLHVADILRAWALILCGDVYMLKSSVAAWKTFPQTWDAIDKMTKEEIIIRVTSTLTESDPISSPLSLGANQAPDSTIYEKITDVQGLIFGRIQPFIRNDERATLLLLVMFTSVIVHLPHISPSRFFFNGSAPTVARSNPLFAILTMCGSMTMQEPYRPTKLWLPSYVRAPHHIYHPAIEGLLQEAEDRSSLINFNKCKLFASVPKPSDPTAAPRSIASYQSPVYAPKEEEEEEGHYVPSSPICNPASPDTFATPMPEEEEEVLPGQPINQYAGVMSVNPMGMTNDEMWKLYRGELDEEEDEKKKTKKEEEKKDEQVERYSPKRSDSPVDPSKLSISSLLDAIKPHIPIPRMPLPPPIYTHPSRLPFVPRPYPSSASASAARMAPYPVREHPVLPPSSSSSSSTARTAPYPVREYVIPAPRSHRGRDREPRRNEHHYRRRSPPRR